MVFFGAYDTTAGRELWKSDGTTTTRVADINPGSGDSYLSNLVAVGSTVFFRAYDPTAGCELWKSDGTTTTRAADINAGSGDSYTTGRVACRQVAVGSAGCVTACDPTEGCELWKSDGTTTTRVADINPGGGSSFLTDLVAVGSTVFFTACDLMAGCALWKSDGTTTTRAADINAGFGDSD